MSTKHTSKCLQKAADNEPIFVLRAQDSTAPILIRIWMVLNEGNVRGHKHLEAERIAWEMEQWPGRKKPD